MLNNECCFIVLTPPHINKIAKETSPIKLSLFFGRGSIKQEKTKTPTLSHEKPKRSATHMEEKANLDDQHHS